MAIQLTLKFPDVAPGTSNDIDQLIAARAGRWVSFRAPFNMSTLELVEPQSEEEARAIHALVRECGSYEVYWERCLRSDWLLDLLSYASNHWHVATEPLQIPLRRFACWCARECQPRHPGVDPVLVAAEDACEGRATLQQLTAVREQTLVVASPAGVTGIRHCCVNAAATLSAWHAGNPDAFAAAWWAARYAAMAAMFTVAQNGARRLASQTEEGQAGEDCRPEHYADAHPDIIVAAERSAQRRQADVLRFLIGNPFKSDASCSASRRTCDVT